MFMGSMKGKKGTPGAPLKLTDEMIKRIASLIGAGVTPEVASAAVGVSRKTLYEWLKIGSKKRSGRHKALSDAVNASAANAEANHVIVLDRAGKGIVGDVVRDKDGNVVTDKDGKTIVARKAQGADWKASAWLLERRFSQRWRSRQTVENIDVPQDEGRMSAEDEAALDEELEQLRKANKATE